MDHLSPLAWVGIGLICIIVVVMNVGLVTFLRYKPRLEIKLPKTNQAQQYNRLVGVMKDPFGEERKQLNALSGLVDQLKDKKKDP
jgi:hypothetical protein